MSLLLLAWLGLVRAAVRAVAAFLGLDRAAFLSVAAWLVWSEQLSMQLLLCWGLSEQLSVQLMLGFAQYSCRKNADAAWLGLFKLEQQSGGHQADTRKSLLPHLHN